MLDGIEIIKASVGLPVSNTVSRLFGEKIRPAKIYGWHVDPSVSDPYQAVTYLADAVGKTPAAMGASTFSYGDWENVFFMPRPCMLRYDGTVAYYLDPNDYTKKADGTASDVANASFGGNAMMEWPLIWYKFEAGEAEGEGYFYCSDKQVDENYHCWCNYDANGNVIPHFYTAIYNGTGTSKLRSLSGIRLTQANGSGSTTVSQEISRAAANNISSDIEWFTEVWSDRLLISSLLILIGKSLNDQAAFGRGIDTGGENAKNQYVTGTLDKNGLFWGNISSGTNGVKVFGMENFYGCLWHRIAGLIGSSTGYLIKMTQPYNTDGTGYSTVSGKPTEYGCVTKMNFGTNWMLPLETQLTDISLYWSESFSNGSGCALLGGMSGDGQDIGSMRTYFSSDTAVWSIGGSLSCKPVISE